MLFVTAVLNGGFANRIFIIHAALNYAKETNRKFALIPNLIIDNAHESKVTTHESLESLFGKFTYYTGNDYKSWKYINDPNQNAFSFKNPQHYPGYSVIFDGYFQNPKYFISSPPSPLIKKKKKLNTYFLHIRLGDYCTIDCYQIPLKKYYSDAIMQITENDINAKFLIFSNENAKAQVLIRDIIKVPFDYTFSETTSALDTLLEMASCSGGICANSSLSWMAAYYQDEPRQHIFMPKPWLKVNYEIDIYPDWANVITATK